MFKRFLYLILTIAAISCNSRPDSVVKNSAGYTVPDARDVVMYEVNPRVFAASSSFNAVVKQLPLIEALGVNVLWFMPVYEIGQVNSINSPYCIKDYQALNPEFGTLEEFDKMVEEAHNRGMSVILDWVANHTSWDNEWIYEHPEWYTQDSSGNIIHPEGTNWTDVADLNFDNAEMRAAMIDAMKFWITEHNVDGFRCDAADYVPFDFWQEAVAALREIPDRELLLLAEGQREDHFDAGFDMNYAWSYLSALRRVYHNGASATELIKADSLEYVGLEPGKVKLRFTTNHDEAASASAVSEFGGERGAMAAFVATTFIHGGMLIYSSQEVGFSDAINFFNYVAVDWAADSEYREEYRVLVSFYNNHPAIRKGELVTYPDDNVLMFSRTYDDEHVFVAVNLRNEEMSVSTIIGEMQLDPYEYVIEIID